MSTIKALVNAKQLIRVSLRLYRGELENRMFYALPAFVTWLEEELPQLAALDDKDVSPSEQFRILLRDYLIGRPLNLSRDYRRLKPGEKDVFELKTADLRVFGWFYRQDIFIASFGDSMERVKTHGLYDGYRDETVRLRAALPLDEPRWLVNAKEDDVISF
jgi:hypothetical protein